MFTYIDTTVRQRLVKQNKLVRIDARGGVLNPVELPAEGQTAINLLGPIPLPLQLPQGSLDAQWFAAVRHTDLDKVEQLASDLSEQGGQRFFSGLASFMAVNSVLMIGDMSTSEPPLIRIHSSCLTGDVFGSQRCDCGPQFDSALQRIAADPQGGMIVYMAGHEGRGIGLWAKAATYLLQDAGENTYEANRSLGLPDDSRDFSDAAALLHYFVGNRAFRLLTNNPKKISDLAAAGLTRVSVEKHVVGLGDANRRYLRAKRDWGHRLSDDDLA